MKSPKLSGSAPAADPSNFQAMYRPMQPGMAQGGMQLPPGIQGMAQGSAQPGMAPGGMQVSPAMQERLALQQRMAQAQPGMAQGGPTAMPPVGPQPQQNPLQGLLARLKMGLGSEQPAGQMPPPGMPPGGPGMMPPGLLAQGRKGGISNTNIAGVMHPGRMPAENMPPVQSHGIKTGNAMLDGLFGRLLAARGR